MCSDKIKWTEAHFCSLHSQTNIYTLSKVENVGGEQNKVLVSSIDGEVIAMEYQQHPDGIKPAARRIQFTYIPGDAEIVSIDAFTNNEKSQALVVGITFLKIAKTNSLSVSGRYLNIYSCWQLDKCKELDSIAESCQHIDLEYIPYQLTHTSVWGEDAWQTVFLLSGSDNRVHVYCEDVNQSQFEELHSDLWFPEFADLNSCIIWLDIVNVDSNRQRVTALGQQSGLVSVFIVNIARNDILKCYTTAFDGPISTVLLFSDTNNHVTKPAFISMNDEEVKQSLAEPVYHLLVTVAIETSLVYRDVVHEGLDVVMPLPESDQYDIVMCACVVDVDFDGHTELVLGTYGQELLVYKFFPAHQLINKDVDDRFIMRRSSVMPYTPPLLDTDTMNKLRHKSSDITGVKQQGSPNTRRARSQEDLTGVAAQLPDSIPSVSSKGSLSSEDDLFYVRDAYQLLWRQSLTHPILGVDTLDITGDGVNEIVVGTVAGVHVLQPDLNKVAKICEQRLISYTEKHKSGVT